MADDLAPRVLAEQAITLVQDDPGVARRLAEQARTRAQRSHDAEAASVAERALGLACIETGDGAAAVRRLRRARRIADQAGLAQRSGQAGMSLAWALVLCGRGEAALREIDRAAASLNGLDGARLEMLRGSVLHKLDRPDEAFRHYRRALTVFRARGDAMWEGRVLCNRGILHAERGNLAAARADFVRSEAIERAGGRTLGAAQVAQNLAWLSALRGDAPAAFAAFDRAEAAIAGSGAASAVISLDRTNLLLAVGLHDEAHDTLEALLPSLQVGGMRAYLAEAELSLSTAALRRGTPESALVHARRAGRRFRAQRRVRWATLARLAEVRAGWACGQRGARALTRARESAAELEAAGWRELALEARVLAARLALELGRRDVARAELELAAGARRSGPAELRTAAWYARALDARARGDTRAAARAVAAGLRVHAEYRAALGASELRAHAAGAGEDLARLGVALARAGGRPRDVLAASERWRAIALEFPAPVPPADGALAAALAERRRVLEEAHQTILQGASARRLRSRALELERHILALARHTAPGTGPHSSLGIDGLDDALGDRALLALVRDGDEIVGVTIARGRACLHRVGHVRELETDVGALRFALRRIVMGFGVESASQGLRAAANRLERRLLADRRLSDAELVVVPTGALHALPWAALPACSGRPVSVVPSVASWLRAQRRQAHAGRCVCVAGPRLTHAATEAERVAALMPGATVLTGRAATVEATIAALDGCDHAHLATHGTFHAGNPLFSALELADGPLTVFDLQRLCRPPHRIVLSSCDAGLSKVHPGEELMGLAATLLSRGTATVLASVLPLPDAVAAELGGALHTGSSAAAALAAAQAGRPEAAGLVCFGAG